ncbi:transposase [Streptomyces sp. NPDC050564]|uniref:transposase n=1 Tax=Streptomyces sp. NPDC050564 TaxID=3365631 RepID=UPI0037A08E77
MPTRGLLGVTVLAADMDETWRLWETVNARWDEIETFTETQVTNARTEAANTSIKHIKRTGRGYRTPDHYQARTLLRSARRTRRRSPVNQQATTFNCGWPIWLVVRDANIPVIHRGAAVPVLGWELAGVVRRLPLSDGVGQVGHPG